MELSEQEIKDLKQEIQHIFDSGANEIRILNMVKMFEERRLVKSILCGVSRTFKEKCNAKIECLKTNYYDILKDRKALVDNKLLWNERLVTIEGKIEGLKLALNYC